MVYKLKPRRLFQPWEEPPRIKIGYTQMRNLMRSGDVLRFRSDCALGHAIEFFRPGGSHAAVIWRNRIVLNSGKVIKRIEIAEANERGFVPRRLSTVLAGVKGKVYWHQLPTTLEQEDICTLEIDRMIKGDIRYAFHQLYSLMLYRPKIEFNDCICSEGAVRAVIKSGLVAPISWCPTPADLVGLPGKCWEIDLGTVKNYIASQKEAAQ